MNTNQTKPMLRTTALCLILAMCACVFAAALQPQTAWADDVADADEFMDAVNEPSVMEINVTANIDLTDAGVLDVSGKTIDLGGYTISASNFTLIFEGSDFVIQNGTFDAKGGSYALFIGENETSDVVVSDVTLKGGINVYNASNVVLRNVTATGTQYYAIWCDWHGQVIVEDGTFVTNGVAVMGLSLSEGELVIKGGSFGDDSGKPLVLADVNEDGNDKYGTPTISGGSFSEDVGAYLADGYAQLVKADDGSYEVMTPDEALERAGAVVTVDGVIIYYESADDAEAAAGSDAVKSVYSVTFYDGDAVVDVQKVIEGDAATPPIDPDRDGYTFAGWYAEGADEPYDFDAAVTGDLVLTAKYDKVVSDDVPAESGESDATTGTQEADKPSVLAKTADGTPLGAAIAALAASALATALLLSRKGQTLLSQKGQSPLTHK